MSNKFPSLFGGESVVKTFLVGDVMQNVTELAQKEQTVQDAREYAESIVETVREPLMVLDADLKVISANRTFYQNFKTKPEETEGQLIYSLGNQQWNIPKLRELLEEILPKNNSFDNYEVEHDFPDIGKRTMLLNARRIPRAPAKPRIMLIAIEDITERKKVEQIANDAREYAENIVDTVREPLMVLDSDLKVISANRAFYKTFKTKPEETEGQLIYNLGNQQWNIPKLRELLEEILPNNNSFDNYEVEHDFSHVGKRTMLLNARRIFGGANKIEMVLLAIEDITERKRAEALSASETRYRRLFESAKDGIMILDAETGIIVDVNPFLIDMLGYSKEHFLGKSIWEMGLLKDIATNKDKFMELQQQEYIRYEDLPLKTADGRRIEVEFVSNVYVVDHQEVIQCNIRNITERKQIEHKLIEAYQKIKTHTKELEMINENLDSFAYSVSHDLRAPLRAISGFAQVLIDTQSDKVNEETRHYLDRISEGAQKMGQLIDDLLGFSRATRSEIKYEKIDVENIVNDLVNAYRDVEPDRDIEFIVNPLGEVEADKEMLKVVFSNLLQNAVKFTIDRKKARIEIGSEQKEDNIQFYVKDNGIGFDMKYKDKLFKAFQRLQTDERFAGTGIGLTIVKRIVSKHGGDIWANGEVDKGAEFCFTLPLKTHVED
jgi:PAS domain S-box-containing protein